MVPHLAALAPSTCTQQAALSPLLANLHLCTQPGPILTPAAASRADLVSKTRQPSYCSQETRCPKSRKSECSCFVFQTFHFKFYYMVNNTLLSDVFVGTEYSLMLLHSFFFSCLGTRLLFPGIPVRLVWFFFPKVYLNLLRKHLGIWKPDPGASLYPKPLLLIVVQMLKSHGIVWEQFPLTDCTFRGWFKTLAGLCTDSYYLS